MVFGDASLARAPAARRAAWLVTRSRPEGPPPRPAHPRRRPRPARLRARAGGGGPPARWTALCTAPVSKEPSPARACPSSGHTELLARGLRLRGADADGRPAAQGGAGHQPPAARHVPRRSSVRGWCAKLGCCPAPRAAGSGRRPRIAVCGLNPHAGEGGTLGTEEVRHHRPGHRARPGAAASTATGPSPPTGCSPARALPLRRGAGDVPRPGRWWRPRRSTSRAPST